MDGSTAPHVDAVSEAETRKALKALSVPSDRAGLVHLAGHLGLLSVTGWAVLAAPFWWLTVPAMAVHGIVLSFLFAPLHESRHYTAFRTRWLNLAAGWLAGPLLLLPPHWFRLYHLAHHRWTQDPERDPELQVRRIDSLRRHLRHLSALPFWRAQIKLIWRHARGRIRDPFVPEREKPVLVREARIMLGIYGAVAVASVAIGSWLAVQLWVVPAILGQPFLRAYLMAEHGNCPFLPDMFANTRTTFTNRIVRFLAWNMPYHVEHHAYPAVPFHSLPAAHQVLKQRLKVTAEGYVAVQRELIGRY